MMCDSNDLQSITSYLYKYNLCSNMIAHGLFNL